MHGQRFDRRSADSSGRRAALLTDYRGRASIQNHISAHLDAGSFAAAEARSALGALERSVDEPLLDDLRLLVSELVTNSVRHAAAQPDSCVGLDVTLGGGVLRVEASDAGGGFEPSPRAPGQAQDSGWGLYLVDRIADRWGVARSDGTTVWFEIDHVAARSDSVRFL